MAKRWGRSINTQYLFNLSVNTYINSPDNFLNGFTRLSGLTVPGSRYFFKVSSTPDFDNKILSTVESGFEAQNLLKFCPEY